MFELKQHPTKKGIKAINSNNTKWHVHPKNAESHRAKARNRFKDGDIASRKATTMSKKHETPS